MSSNAASSDQITNPKKEVGQLDPNEVEKLRQEIESIRSKLHAAIKKGKNIQKERDVKAQDCNNLQSQLESQQAEHEQEIKSLQNKIETLTGELDLCKQLEGALQTELANIRQQVSAKDGEILTLKEAIQSAASHVQNAQNASAEQSNQLQVEQTENSNLRIRLAELEGRLAVQNNTEAQLEKQNNQLYQLEQEKEEMINKIERQEIEIKAKDEKLSQLQQQQQRAVENINNESFQKGEEVRQKAEKMMKEAEQRLKEATEKEAACTQQNKIFQQQEQQAIRKAEQAQKEANEAKLQLEELRSLEDTRKQRFAVLQHSYGDKEVSLQKSVESLEEQLSLLRSERDRIFKTLEDQQRENSQLNESARMTQVLQDRITELQKKLSEIEKSREEDGIARSQLEQQLNFFKQQLETSHEEQVTLKVRHTKELENHKKDFETWKTKAEELEKLLNEEKLTQESKRNEAQRNVVRVQELENQNRDLKIRLNNQSLQKQVQGGGGYVGSKLEEGGQTPVPPSVNSAPPLVGILGKVLVYRNYLIGLYVLFLHFLVYFVLTHRSVQTPQLDYTSELMTSPVSFVTSADSMKVQDSQINT
eukprot:TRINITY_DN1231_c0_g1_i13.p1 TRINITY_DN1231_c0_g1~~TRINITY_DN1231_c0_g1_i13.p1  ORF type:complete len:591 (+),score=111.27 TRINITY_DN1231_c0_g1_i13:18-1790(+)